MLTKQELEQVARIDPRRITFYERIDFLGGLFVLGFLVLCPWLFGTTEDWSMQAMNALGYVSGALLLLKWCVRWRRGVLAVERIKEPPDASTLAGTWIIRTLAMLTGLVLLYCAISALNARATYIPGEQRFEYYQGFARWLPFSWDAAGTWQAFWNYLALACIFWSLRDWLLHPAARKSLDEAVPLSLPPRLRQLLWTISINATLLALAGIFQKLHGTDKLLWLRSTYMDRPEYMFASFAFRDNAAQYLNLAWPVMVGFWWVLRERARQSSWEGQKAGGAPHIVLLPCAIMTAAAPIIALSRGGALVAMACLLFTVLIFFLSKRATWRTRAALLFVTVSVAALGAALAWGELTPRLRELFKTPYANPNQIYENAKQMAIDYPVFGVGPGAFRSLYQMYRKDAAEPWQAFLHDDWLETRVTFGWVGSGLILSMLALALSRWFAPGGVPCSWEFVAMLWVAVWGCLSYAKFSFPLQIYSVFGLLLTVCCVLTCLSKPNGH